MPIEQHAGNGLKTTPGESEQSEAAQALLRLVTRRAALYTMGDSSSIREETARELMQSVSFTLKLAGCDINMLAGGDAEQLFAAGLRELEELIERGKTLWRAAKAADAGLKNRSCAETLDSIGEGFAQYNYRYLAHIFPCSIDYQLAVPVSEELLGIEYINEYLRRIVAEGLLMKSFPKENIVRLLETYCGDYRAQIINMCEPIIANATALIMLSGDVGSLSVSQGGRKRLALLLEPLSAKEMAKELSEAARELCRMLKLNDGFTVEYAAKSAANLAPRIRAALPGGELAGVFLTTD